MQIEGVKEYVAFPPESERLCIHETLAVTYPKSMLKTLILTVTRYLPVRLVFDLSFILGKHSSYLRVGGILLESSTPSITISVNGVNAANWSSFFRDFCPTGRRRLLMQPYLQIFGFLHLIMGT